MPVKAPFRFARINRWIYEPSWAELVSHDVPFADGLSGEAVVEITARSSILVGGDRRKATGNRPGEVRPFQLPDGGFAIPGSALQGMSRGVLEVAGFGRLGPWVADRKFGIRDLSGTATARAHYQDRLSTRNGNHVTVHSKAGWLMQRNGSPCIVPCEYARIRLTDILGFKQALLGSPAPPPEGVLDRKSSAGERYIWFLDSVPGKKPNFANLNADFAIDPRNPHGHSGGITIRYSLCRHAKAGGTRGTLVLTGKPQHGAGKKLEFVFHTPDRNCAPTTGAPGLPVERDVWEAFLFLHEAQPGREVNPNWDFWKSEFDDERPVPVFYWKDGGRVTTMGTAFAFKAAHRKSARDLLAHSCAGHLDPVETMKLDLPHLLFGVAAEHDGGRGLKRRARFGLARAVGDPQRCTPTHPSILLGPKPSYVGLYVRQRHDNQPIPRHQPLATYTPLHRPNALHLYRPELSGVKIWPARDAGAFNPGPVPNQLANNRKVQAKLAALPPGTVFRSRLTFHNLRPVELGALLWTLSFGDEAAFGEAPQTVTMRHRLGMGKPLGLGEVTIRVTELRMEAACPTGNPAAAMPAASELVRDFVSHMESDAAYGPNWSTSKQVAALLKAARPASQGEDLTYMTLNEYQNAKRQSMYLPDYLHSGDEKSSLSWLDSTILSLTGEHPGQNEELILRGQLLARRWQAIEDNVLKQRALDDIVARWKANGLWDEPPRGAARKAKQIYTGDVE